MYFFNILTEILHVDLVMDIITEPNVKQVSGIVLCCPYFFKTCGGPKRLTRHLLKFSAPALKSLTDEDVKPFVPSIAVPRETIIYVDNFNCVNHINLPARIVDTDKHPRSGEQIFAGARHC